MGEPLRTGIRAASVASTALGTPKGLTIENIPQGLLGSERGADKCTNYRQVPYHLTFSTNFIEFVRWLCPHRERVGDTRGVGTGLHVTLVLMALLAPGVCMQVGLNGEKEGVALQEPSCP